MVTTRGQSVAADPPAAPAANTADSAQVIEPTSGTPAPEKAARKRKAASKEKAAPKEKVAPKEKAARNEQATPKGKVAPKKEAGPKAGKNTARKDAANDSKNGKAKMSDAEILEAEILSGAEPDRGEPEVTEPEDGAEASEPEAAFRVTITAAEANYQIKDLASGSIIDDDEDAEKAVGMDNPFDDNFTAREATGNETQTTETGDQRSGVRRSTRQASKAELHPDAATAKARKKRGQIVRNFSISFDLPLPQRYGPGSATSSEMEEDRLDMIENARHDLDMQGIIGEEAEEVMVDFFGESYQSDFYAEEPAAQSKKKGKEREVRPDTEGEAPESSKAAGKRAVKAKRSAEALDAPGTSGRGTMKKGAKKRSLSATVESEPYEQESELVSKKPAKKAKQKK